MPESYKLTYFDMKGLAEPIRLIFANAEVEYEDIRVNKDTWMSLKPSVEWGKIPILEMEGNKTLAQSTAIARFLARKYNLVGADDWETAKVDELVDVLVDVRQECIKHIMESDPERKKTLKDSFVNEFLPSYFSKFEAQLAKKTGEEGKLFMIGEGLTWADLFFIHLVNMTETIVDPDILKNFPRLSLVRKNVCDIPQIKSWLEKRPKTDK